MSQPWVAAPRRQVWAHGVFVLGRVMITVSLLCTTYFLIPSRNPGAGFGVGWLALQLCVFAAVVGAQVPAIIRSRYPVMRAIEALAVLVAVYLLIFARIYVANSQDDPAGFSSPLDHVTALYFTVTVFATVGFGDVVARTDSMKLLVTVQMLLNLTVLGLGIRLLTSAARRGIARRGDQGDVGERDRPGF
jgi:UDP-N-acetylmuramyl pentapeptide phosphotransferase/UDP-N-acetylglucosamine-1-phosphate transferase